MNSRSLIAIGAVVALNIVITFFLLVTRNNGEPDARRALPAHSAEIRRLEQSVKGLRTELRDLNDVIGGVKASDGTPAIGSEGDSPRDDPEAVPGLSERLASVETALTKLESAMAGISIEAASEERDDLFRSEDGHLKADEYFEAGKFAIAGEGYLKFLQNHPEHPDARSILSRARNAFSKAGYKDKAFWVQDEIMKHFPEQRAEDLWKLARMEKDNESYANAAVHAAESAELLSSDEKYWRLLYAAWYAELAHGQEAGLAYYRDVQQQIIDAGQGGQKLGQRAQEKIDELERRIARRNP